MWAFSVTWRDTDIALTINIQYRFHWPCRVAISCRSLVNENNDLRQIHRESTLSAKKARALQRTGLYHSIPASSPNWRTQIRDLPVSRGKGPTLHFPANELDSQLCLPSVIWDITWLAGSSLDYSLPSFSRDLQMSRGEGPTLKYPANEVDSQLCLPSVLLRDHRCATAFCPSWPHYFDVTCTTWVVGLVVVESVESSDHWFEIERHVTRFSCS